MQFLAPFGKIFVLLFVAKCGGPGLLSRNIFEFIAINGGRECLGVGGQLSGYLAHHS